MITLAAKYLSYLRKPVFFGGLFVLLAFGLSLGEEVAAASPAPALRGESATSTEFLAMMGGENRKLVIKLKNTGTTTWTKGNYYLETGPFLRATSQMRHSSWLNAYRLQSLPNDVGPGQSVSLSATLLAPTGLYGTIQENYQLVAGDKVVLGTLTRVFIDITQKPAAYTYNNKSTSGSAQTTPAATAVTTVVTRQAEFCSATTMSASDFANCKTAEEEEPSSGVISNSRLLATEPMMRIGLFTAPAAQRVSMASLYDVYAGQNVILSGVSPSETIILSFSEVDKMYAVTYRGNTKFYANHIRVVPRTNGAVATLADFDSRKTWGSKYNDNRFRHIIEMRHSKATGKVWIINELPINQYLKGMAESSNASPVEFHKVLITAARTYAMYHYFRGVDNKVLDGSTKHADEHFHVDANYDQVYRGYNSELRIPNLAKAVDETSGQALTHNGQLVIAPYFSNSDGRTRSWTEVWGGTAKPWLVSVSAPEDKGLKLWGHGVGMSARAALVMVTDGKKSWQTVLSHFYQGTKLQKIY
jgi:hypothetical protein